MMPGISFVDLITDEKIEEGEKKEDENKPTNNNNGNTSKWKQKKKQKKNKVIQSSKKKSDSFLSVYSIALKSFDNNNNYNDITCIVKQSNIAFNMNPLLFSKAREKNKTLLIAKDIEEKFYNQRYYLFSLYDQGIQMDSESWYSVTPEELSIYIAKLCKNKTVLDAFCGCGGNTIQFSKECSHVYSIDLDETKIKLSVNNTKVYNCPDNITFINIDYLQYDPKGIFVDYVFLSPPWGGVDYTKDDTFSLKKWITPDIHDIIQKSLKCGRNLLFYLPRSTNIKEFLTIISECQSKSKSCNDNKEEEDDNEEQDNSIFIDVRYLYSAKKIKAILILYGEDINTVSVKDLREYLEKIYDKQSRIVLKQTINLTKHIGVNMFITKELLYRSKHSKCTLKQFNEYLSLNQNNNHQNDHKQINTDKLIPLNKFLSIDDYNKLIANIIK